MIISRLSGGIGNQLFQYSLGLYLSIKNDSILKVDVNRFNSVNEFRNYSLDDIISDINIASDDEIHDFTKKSWLNPFSNRKVVNEKKFEFDNNITKLKGSLYLNGFWQSEKYFLPIKDILKDKIKIKSIFNPSLYNKFRSEFNTKNSVCIFVRRAELVTNKTFESYHGYCKEDYYYRAIQYISNKIENPFFYIFSDDIEWCIEKFGNLNNSQIVLHFDNDINYTQYFYLMSYCRNFIISNSTYGWWAAWLSISKDKIVIVPNNWFNQAKHSTIDLFPPDWIVL